MHSKTQRDISQAPYQMFPACHLNTGRNDFSTCVVAVYRWVSGPLCLWCPSCLHPAAAAALQPGEDCSDTHHHEQLQLLLEELTQEVLVEVFALQKRQRV